MSIPFWKAKSLVPDDADETGDETQPAPAPAVLSYVAVAGVVAMLAAHTVFAGPVIGYSNTIAAQLFAPDTYISTVIETPGKLSDKPAEEEY